MTAITSGCPSDRQVSTHQHRAIIEPAVDNRNQQAPASLDVFAIFQQAS
jgi:heterodisulfide reductase subunit C